MRVRTLACAIFLTTGLATAQSCGAGLDTLGLAPAPTPSSPPSYKYFVYTTHQSNNAVGVFGLDPATGLLSPGTPPTVTAPNAAGIAVDPAGKHVYVTDYGDQKVLIFDIDPRTGSLTPNASPSSGTADIDPKHIVIHPNGRFAYVSSEGPSFVVSIFAIDPNTGALTQANPASASAEPQPDGLAIDPTGTRLFVVNWGANSIFPMSLDPNTGALSPGTPATVGSKAFTVFAHPSGNYAYVANPSSGGISIVDVATNGSLSTPFGDFRPAGMSQPWWVTGTADGKYVFATDQTAGKVFGMTVDTGNRGALASTSQGSIATPGGATPNGMVVSPVGNYLYAIDATGAISQFSYSSSTGTLTSLNPGVVNAPTGSGTQLAIAKVQQP